MDNSVVIKGGSNGIAIVLDSTMPFSELKERFARKIKASAAFLGNCKVAVAFENRELSSNEELALLDIISENSELDVLCVLGKDVDRTKPYRESVKQNQSNANKGLAQFYKGSLRSGQSLEMDQSIVIMGDVKPGSSVTSNGNIIVLGSLKGVAYAGASGNSNAFVFALDMVPIQIRIADLIARPSDKPDHSNGQEAQIAFIEDGRIYVLPYTKDVLNDIKLS